MRVVSRGFPRIPPSVAVRVPAEPVRYDLGMSSSVPVFIGPVLKPHARLGEPASRDRGETSAAAGSAEGKPRWWVTLDLKMLVVITGHGSSGLLGEVARYFWNRESGAVIFRGYQAVLPHLVVVPWLATIGLSC